MTDSLTLPIRVLVKGASTVNWVSWMGGPRSDFTFPRVIEDELARRGRPSWVQSSTMTSEKTRTILATWQREVLNFSPDVIVLVYGHYETIHLFLPRWLERHANSLKAKPRRLSHLYRDRILRPVWRVLAHAQAALDSRIDPTRRRSRPRHVAADLERYLSHVEKVGSPLVYVFELLPPAQRYHGWFPGMEARMAVMNRALADMVERQDSDRVRYFKVSELVAEHFGGDLEEATPDGFHYSPKLHREVGAALAHDIDAWSLSQPHLGDREI